MDELLNQLLAWAINIKNQTQVEGNTSTIVGDGLERLIRAVTSLQEDKASAEDLKTLNKELQTMSIKFKGYHTTIDELNANPSTNKKDDFAWVGTPYPGTVYCVQTDGGKYIDTQEAPPLDKVDLGEYVKKEEITDEIIDDKNTVPNNSAVHTLKSSLFGSDTGGIGDDVNVHLVWRNGLFYAPDGTLNNGNPDYSVTEEIPVIAGQKYTAKLKCTPNAIAITYWSAGVLNKDVSILGKNRDSVEVYEFIIPVGVKSIKLCGEYPKTAASLTLRTAFTSGAIPKIENSVYELGNEVDTLKAEIDSISDAIYEEQNGDGWIIVSGYKWTSGYYVDKDGNISGAGTNALYRMSDPIPVKAKDTYKAFLRAGNLLAVSGWTNGQYNKDLSVLGKNTDVGIEYRFVIPEGVTEIRLTSRVELLEPTLHVLTKDSTIIVNKIDRIENDMRALSGMVAPKSNIAEFGNFVGNNTLVGNTEIINDNTFQYTTNTAVEDLDFVAKIFVEEDNSKFGLSRIHNEFGSKLVVYDNKVEVSRFTGSSVYSYTMPFSITKGQTYIIRMYKKNKDIQFIIQNGSEIFVGYAERTGTRDFGRNWGRPSVFCQMGKVTVKDAFIRKYVFTSPMFFTVGDSLVEGWGVVDKLDKRYVALMRDALGGKMEIAGRGGETTNSLLERFRVEISKMGSQYVFLDIGRNDLNLDTFKSNMAVLIEIVLEHNMYPILTTITPRQGMDIRSMNAFIKEQGYPYIDANAAVNNGNEGAWNTAYVNSDNVHPNVLGNEKIFNRILFDIPQMFDTSVLYDVLKEYR